MVLGLIDFLLGGKKKVSKTAQVQTPTAAVQDNQPQTPVAGGQVPDGANTTTPNVGVQFVDSTQQSVQANGEVKVPQSGEGTKPVEGNGKPSMATSTSSAHSGQKKSISEVIHKLHNELSESKDRITEIVTDVKKIDNSVMEMGHRIDTLEENRKVIDDKLAEVDENMTKFLSLYELINNQYNPFVDKESVLQVPKAEVRVTADGESDEHHNDASLFESPLKGVTPKKTINLSGNDLDSALLELDTLNIEEAAGDAVPLRALRNNTNSLVVILSWLEYLIKKVGIEETRNSLRYYTETLRWITPEVFFDLDKYLRGMKDKVAMVEGGSLSVKDHIVSLYFISKLNEKKLDEKLTNAVLQIIKIE